MMDWLCYCGGLHNAKRQLEKSDIKKAFDWYRQQTGKDAKVIRIHPKVQHLAGDLPDGIQVIPWPGTSSWSIDMAETLPVPEKDTVDDFQPIRGRSTLSEDCNTTGKVSGEGKGMLQPKNSTSDEVINRLADEGLSSRQIAEHLSMLGQSVSHMTVSRHLKKVKVGSK